MMPIYLGGSRIDSLKLGGQNIGSGYLGTVQVFGASAPSAGWVDAVTALAPTCWWRFGESSGTTAADEQAVLDGTYVGTVGRVSGLIPGDADGAAGLDTSIANYIGTAFHAALNNNLSNTPIPITIGAVIQTTNTGVAMIASRDGETSNRFWQFRLNTGGVLQGIWWDQTNTLRIFDSGAATFNDGNPHLVGMSIDSGGAKLYADGAEVGSMTGGTVRAVDASIGIRFGRTHGSSSVAFNGTIDEGMYDTRAWTAAEWSDLFTASGL
jgi:hypothetical protein